MYAAIGTIKGNTVLTNDCSLERYNGKKVVITVLDDETQYDTISDEELFALADSLINRNLQAYKQFAKR